MAATNPGKALFGVLFVCLQDTKENKTLFETEHMCYKK